MSPRSLEERIQRMEDVHEIQNLMGRYAYYHVCRRHKEQAAMFARKTPVVRAEIGGWGVWEGKKECELLYEEAHPLLEGDPRGVMFMHALTTPVIEIAGDGKTAKALWISPGHETTKKNGKVKACWAWCKYGIDLVKEDGKWKFWHFHVYGIFLTPYDKSWAEVPDEQAATAVSLPDRLKPNKPSRYHWMYTPETATEDIPQPPEPYETWDESKAY